MSKNYFKCECCGQVFLNESSMSTNNKNRCIHCYDFTRQQDIEIFALKTWLKTKENRIDEIRDSFLTKISNLEAKLAEKDKAIENWQTMYQSVMQSCHNGIEEDKRLREQLAEKEKEIAFLKGFKDAVTEDIKQQLAEKDKWLRATDNHIKQLKEKEQDKISFALEQIMQIREKIDNSGKIGIGLTLDGIYEIDNIFDNQIAELTHQHEDKGE